jgi:threonine aldolase
VFRLAPGAPDSATVVAGARERGLVLFPFGPRTIRLVTHLDVTRADCELAADILLATIG